MARNLARPVTAATAGTFLRELRHQGWRVRRIADELHVGPSTVQPHLPKEQVIVGG